MLGSKTVLRMLSKYGYADQAYELATKEESPSWGNWIKRGLTALPETWKLSPTFKDASLNHVFLGDINAWMYNVLAGINFDEQSPGFKHILIHPHFAKGLDWVKAEYHSVNGLIKSEWKRSGNKVVLDITIPTNTSATVEVGTKKSELCAGTHQLIF
jgi:alpha-L-rhamnosidase